jgi:hypothetical protein
VEQIGPVQSKLVRQASRYAGVAVAQAGGSESGQQVEVLAALVVEQPGSLGALEDAPVAEDAQQLDEGGVDVAGVSLDGGVGQCMSRQR